MNKEQYADFWETESKDFNSNKIYEKLSKSIPSGKVLEIGCGIGFGTHYLSKNREVLSLDNNKSLIEKAKSFLNSKNDTYKIHYCELFQLTQNDVNIIHQFKANTIIGWFLGAGGKIVNNHTKEEDNINYKGKLYREKLEDIIVSKNLLIDSVETINLVLRGALSHKTSKEELFNSTKLDYDTNVFKDIGFEVVNVEVIDWNTENSNFTYTSVKNKNVPDGEVSPSIISITAKRIN
jgi:SAM-dependent methyltransferase